MGALDWMKSRAQDWIDSKLDPIFRAKLKALPTRQNEYGFDPFGFNRDNVKTAAMVARFLYRNYFRAEAHGIENVPPAGRVLLVANHSGQLPFDGVVIGVGVFLEPTAAAPRARDGRELRADRAVRVVPVRALGPDHRHAGELPAPARRGRGDPRLSRGRARHLEAVLEALPARGVRARLHAARARDARADRAGRGRSAPRSRRPRSTCEPLAKLLGAPSFPIVPYPPFVAGPCRSR